MKNTNANNQHNQCRERSHSNTNTNEQQQPVQVPVFELTESEMLQAADRAEKEGRPLEGKALRGLAQRKFHDIPADPQNNFS